MSPLSLQRFYKVSPVLEGRAGAALRYKDTLSLQGSRRFKSQPPARSSKLRQSPPPRRLAPLPFGRGGHAAANLCRTTSGVGGFKRPKERLGRPYDLEKGPGTSQVDAGEAIAHQRAPLAHRATEP